MLVLAVPEGDYVEVNGPCRIYVIRNGLTPRLGFEANKDTEIKRAKFCEKKPESVGDK